MENCFVLFILPSLGGGCLKGQERGLCNGKLKVENGKLFRYFYFTLPWGRVSEGQERGLCNGKLKVENGKLFRSFYFTLPWGRVSERTGEGFI